MSQSLLRRLRGVHDDEKGFTLIELLVVILVIGVLAAIALPNFLGQKDKARDATAKSAVRNAVSQLESCLTGAATATSCSADASTVTSRDAAATGGSTNITTFDSFDITSMSETGNSFKITKTGGAVTRTCSSAGSTSGACPTAGTW